MSSGHSTLQATAAKATKTRTPEEKEGRPRGEGRRRSAGEDRDRDYAVGHNTARRAVLCAEGRAQYGTT